MKQSIKITKIREEDINNIKKLKEFPNIIHFLKNGKTSTSNSQYKNEKNLLIYDITNNVSNINLSESNNSCNQTAQETISIYSNIIDLNSFQQSNSSIIIEEDVPEKKFNIVRANYYLKYKFYDIPLNTDNFNIKYPPIYYINDKYYAYVYPNDLTTYSIAISGYMIKNTNNKIENLAEEEKNKSIYYNSLGLFFCGQTIENVIGDETQIKVCEPNKYMCKNCIERNKRKYNIKKNYLININGRVCKKNLGFYHCFGHFLCGNQIEDCISKFQCKACQFISDNFL